MLRAATISCALVAAPASSLAGLSDFDQTATLVATAICTLIADLYLTMIMF